jgi:hypothetical protein
MTLPVTITDRFRAAWRAFNQNTKADPDALTKYMAAREAERSASLDKLDGYVAHRELGHVTSAGNTED